MRVCQVTHTFLPDFIGGREIHVLNLSKTLGQQGVEVQILTGGRRGKQCSETISDKVSVTRLPMLTLPLASGSSRVNQRLLPSLPFTLMKSNADLIHAHDYYHLSSDMCAWTAMVSGRPLVLTVHSRLGFFSVNKPLEVLEKIYNGSFGKLTLKRAEKVIFMSWAAAKEFLDSGLVREDKVEVIHPSVDLDELNRVFDSLNRSGQNFYTRKFGFNDNQVVLFVGRVEKRKGLQYVFQAMSSLVSEFPKIKMVIVGPDAGYISELKHMANSLNIDQYVIFSGILSDEEVEEAMFFADVFVLPSEHENFPEVALRVACLGRPIIASNTGGIPEFVEDGKIGLLVKVGDSHGFSTAMKRIINDKELASKLGKSARDKVLKDYAIHKMAAKTRRVYDEVIGSRR